MDLFLHEHAYLMLIFHIIFIIIFFIPASFPNHIPMIYSSVVMLQCRHFPNCREMPDSVCENLATLKKAGSSAPSSSGNKCYDKPVTMTASSQDFSHPENSTLFRPTLLLFGMWYPFLLMMHCFDWITMMSSTLFHLMTNPCV